VTLAALLDNSAWARLASPDLPPKRRSEIAAQIEAGAIAVCLPFLLEAGYSARNADDHRTLVDQLRALPYLGVDDRVEARAVEAQAELARAGHHRLPPVDLLTAALAERYDVGVLHYDSDYDVIRQKTSLKFKSIWLARRGRL
jgi:predicted nucleic acid-binding protein